MTVDIRGGIAIITDSIVALGITVIGVLIVSISVIALAVRGKRDQVVVWRGFGVTFEIKPCVRCPMKER